MNKKNFYEKLLAIMMVTIMGVFLASCSDDDNNKENGGGNSSDIIQTLKSNKWIAKDFSYGEGANNHAWVDDETWTLYFTSDNSGISYWIQKDYDTDLGNSTTKDYSLFEYKVSGNKVTLTYEDWTTLTLYYQGGYLTTESMGTIFEPSQMTYNDYEFVKTLGPQTGSGGNDVRYSYDDRTQRLTISGKGRMNDYTASNQPWYDKVISEIVIENGITYIGSHAFHKLKWGSNVSKIELPNSIEEIGDYAFCDLGIEEFMVPTGVRRIGNYAFSDCDYLKKVNFYGCDALEEIGDYAFAFCPINLGYFTVPKNVKKIGSMAFISSSCNSLTLNDKLESIGNAVFVKISASKLEIPNSVKYIGSQAFRGSFSEIRIGTGLTSIENMPFVSSKSGNMYVNLGIPLEIPSYNYIILNTNGDNAAGSWTLYVPKGCKSAYQKANGWKAFKSINEDSSLTSGNGMPDNNDQEWVATGTVQGHDYVDLGLPSGTFWATTNIGAEKPEDYGDYFAWGETIGYNGGKKSFNWSTYKHCGGSSTSMLKYCTNSEFGNVDNKTKLEPIDDAATVIWGEVWHMPTEDQFEELINSSYTTLEMTIVNGVNGLKITSKSNMKSIFLPAAGYRKGTSLDYDKQDGRYWSRSLSIEYHGYVLAFGLAPHSYGKGYSGSLNIRGSTRFYGYSVRPVF